MHRFLLTIHGTSRSLEMAVPADTPLGGVLASIVEAIEEQPVNGPVELEHWRLTLDDGRILNPRASLVESGVHEGTPLYLRHFAEEPISPGLGLEPASAPVEQVPVHPTLPEPVPLGERLRATAGAFVSAGSASSEQPEPPLGSPKRLAVPRPRSPFERAQAAWFAGDYQRRLEQVIAAPRLSHCVTIAVVSPKGGVGKTTTSIMLGTLLAMVRSDRVVAVDTNPDHGTLGRSLAPEHEIYVDDLLGVVDQPALTVTMLDRFLARAPHGMLVLPAPTDPERMDQLDGQAYERVIRRLQEMVNILVLDCGAGMRDPVTRTALANADQVVLVSDADPATASLVADVARRLPADASYAMVVNKLPRLGSRLNFEHLAEDVSNARAVVKIEADGEAAERVGMGDFTWQDSPPEWRIAIRQLAAHLAADWEALGRTA